MPVFFSPTRIQDQLDFASVPGAGNDGYALTWDDGAGAFVLAEMAGGGGVTDHGALTGLADDDHTQYALLAGRATPQTLAFGSASGATAGYLTSTSHATKGSYALNAAGTIVVDEVNGRLIVQGVVTAGSPASGAGNALTLTGSAAVSGNTNGGNLNLLPGLKSGSGADGTVVVQAVSASPGANIFTVQNFAGTSQFRVDAFNAVHINTSLTVPIVNAVTLSQNGSNSWQLGAGIFFLNSTTALSWSSTSSYLGAKDAGLARSAAGIVKATNGSSGLGALLLGAPTTTTIGLTVQGIASQTAPLIQLQGISSTATVRERANIDAIAVDNTDATRKYALVLSPWDTAAREAMRLWADGSAGRCALSAPASAPTDAHLANGQWSSYLDESGHNLVIRARYSDGTLKTVTLPLI